MDNNLELSCTSTTRPFPQNDGGIGIYFPCPDCGTYFKSTGGFADHMTVEHWWEPQHAVTYWDRQPTLKSA